MAQVKYYFCPGDLDSGPRAFQQTEKSFKEDTGERHFMDNFELCSFDSSKSRMHPGGFIMVKRGRGDPMIRSLGRMKPDREWYPDDFDWYLKWVASIIVLCSLAMRAAGPEFRIYDLAFGFVGILLWCWVSVIWKDRALIMLNTVSLFMLGVALLKEFQ